MMFLTTLTNFATGSSQSNGVGHFGTKALGSVGLRKHTQFLKPNISKSIACCLKTLQEKPDSYSH